MYDAGYIWLGVLGSFGLGGPFWGALGGFIKLRAKVLQASYVAIPCKLMLSIPKLHYASQRSTLTGSWRTGK